MCLEKPHKERKCNNDLPFVSQYPLTAPTPSFFFCLQLSTVVFVPLLITVGQRIIEITVEDIKIQFFLFCVTL